MQSQVCVACTLHGRVEVNGQANHRAKDSANRVASFECGEPCGDVPRAGGVRLAKGWGRDPGIKDSAIDVGGRGKSNGPGGVRHEIRISRCDLPRWGVHLRAAGRAGPRQSVSVSLRKRRSRLQSGVIAVLLRLQEGPGSIDRCGQPSSWSVACVLVQPLLVCVMSGRLSHRALRLCLA